MYVNNLTTGTRPLIIHAPGLQHSSEKKLIHMAFNPCWIPIIKNWEKQFPVSCRQETKKELTIITWNSTDKKGFCEYSLERLGLDYLCLGKNIKKWRFIDKITTALEVIDTINTPYVMALDCFDIIILRDPHEAVGKFKKINCDMLVNGEKNYHPDFGLMTTGKYAITDKWKKYERSIAESEWKFVNAGALIAKTRFYKEFLIECLKRHEEIKNHPESFPLPRDPVFKKYPDYKVSNDDQLIYHWMYFDYYPRIMIDYRMEIFFNTIHTAFDKSKLVITDNIFMGASSLKYSINVRVLSFLLKVYLALSKLMIAPVMIKNILRERFSRIS
jgi:hypothetical protein